MSPLKKSLFAAAFTLFLATPAFSQQGYYLRPQAGYASSFLGFRTFFTLPKHRMRGESVGGWGNGGGFNTGLAAGRMFTRHIGAEVGASYWWGNTSTDVLWREITINHRFNSARVAPAIVLSTGGDRLNVYGRAGVVAAFVAIGRKQETIRYLDNQTSTYDRRFSDGFSAGASFSTGFTYPVSPKLKAFAEASLTYLGLRPAAIKTVHYTHNGTDQMHTLPPEQTDWQSLTYSGFLRGFDARSLGLNAGLQITLSKQQ